MHTPGPWKRRLTPSKKPGTLIEREAGGAYIASVNYRTSLKETETNANLIVAAPDLFAACQSAIQTLETIGDQVGWDNVPADIIPDTINGLEAAIARATGQE